MTQHLITRKEWGAVEQDGTRDRALPISEWWAHHSVTVAPDLLPPFDDDDAAIRTLERIGEQRFGTGISYTFPVTPVGRCYQGHSMHRVGSHTRGHNTVAAAIVFVGDYSTRRPSAAAQEAAAQRMVIEHRAGRARTHRFDGGHTQAPVPEGGTAQTACPGAGVLAVLPAINARADALWAAGFPNTPTEGEFIMATQEQLVATLTSPEVLAALRHAIVGGPVCKNPLDPTSKDKVALGFVAELGATTALKADARIAALEGVVAKLVENGELTADEVRAAAQAGAQAALDATIDEAKVVLEVAAGEEAS
ncbi:hypothetical protein ACK8HX_02035 [Oryzobacter sp. R7]|uniref:hypothetical protein n=1 Tax=Oryzobacter faecalis TaxID=3388656 RepID=UPI00398CAC00